MRETFVTVIAFVVVICGLFTCVDLANSEEITKQGPAYILPVRYKPKHIIRIKCTWADNKLNCGPAIGTRWFKEWEWK